MLGHTRPMPHSIWKGTISFGLISIPVRLFGATEEKDLSFRQVHAADGGRIRLKRVCEACGNEIPFAQIAKGYETSDGRMAILDKQDFASLPLPTAKTVEVVEFVAESDIDPAYYDRSYFLEADSSGAKPYVLLRDALRSSGRVAVVKVALRSRESLALVRVKGDVLMLHTILWPDEVRDGSFAVPSSDVTATDAEVAMATMFIDQLSGDFDPSAFSDDYRQALESVVDAKLAGLPAPEPEDGAPPAADVVDLVAALRASVEAAKKRREEATEATG